MKSIDLKITIQIPIRYFKSRETKENYMPMNPSSGEIETCCICHIRHYIGAITNINVVC